MKFLILVLSSTNTSKKGTQEKTVITREYSVDWKRGDEPYYPINDERNNAMFAKISRRSSAE